MAFVPLIVAAFVVLVFASVTVALHRREDAALTRRSAIACLACMVAAPIAGIIGTVGGLVLAFSEVSASTPADKATRLAAGISHSMNWTAAGFGTGLLLLLPTILLFRRAGRLSARGARPARATPAS